MSNGDTLYVTTLRAIRLSVCVCVCVCVSRRYRSHSSQIASYVSCLLPYVVSYSSLLLASAVHVEVLMCISLIETARLDL